MLTDLELDRLFAAWKTPEAGRALVRGLRTNGPVRNLQGRMDTVRTRLISKKMGRALYAESRTVELPAIFMREHDKSTQEIWPQPWAFDLRLKGPTGGTRVQHTPDLFLITDEGFVMEEWREEERLLRMAAERPNHFFKDESKVWHYLPIEEHLATLGISYRLRSADELPRSFIANLWFLEDYSLESTPLVPESEAVRLVKLLDDCKHAAHLELVHEHGFKADHVFQLLMDERVYVDLHATTLSRTEQLTIYRNKVIAQAEALFQRSADQMLPASAYAIRVGSRFLYDDKPYEVVLLGKTDVIARDERGTTSELPLTLIRDLFAQSLLDAGQSQPVEREFDPDVLLAKENRLKEAMRRLDALRSPNGDYSERSLRRFRAAIRGITAPQDQLQALMSCNEGNRSARLPREAIELAEAALLKHNTPANPTIFATYNIYVALCDGTGVVPMGQSSFYQWVKARQDVRQRAGKRKEYQQKPIPLNYDYEHPVHGVLAHEVVYCDHTVPNIFLKGMRLPNLGKPVLTLMVDGAMTKARAFYLSYRPPSTVSVLLCLRDYARRNGRLPKVLVLDNGREFHSEALKLFCSLFGIAIRWRRRSKPRDSTMVERMLGATEQEVISSLDGNSIALKDPRMVSTTHHPDKHIQWTLPALHGSLESYLFDVHANRIHPRLGLSPNEFERRHLLEHGAREHVMVRYDSTFKLLTAPHSGQSTRAVDRMRGVFVDGRFYWNDRLALSKKDERVEVRVEIWHARVVYVCFRGDWMVAQARDGGRLEGRFRDEVETERREETRRSRTAASNDKQSVVTSKKRQALWVPEIWDERLREQLTEEYWLYSRLGMTEVLPEATNPDAGEISLPLRSGSDLPLLRAIEHEPDMLPTPSDLPTLNEPPRSQLVAAHDLDVATEGASKEDDDEGYF